MSFFKRLFGQYPKPHDLELVEIGYVHPGEIILNFHDQLQKYVSLEELSDSEFAMWLPCEEDPIFANSPIVEKWSSTYRLYRNNWTYITGDLLNHFELIDAPRAELPDEFLAFGVLTRDNEELVLSLCQEKGIRFHFATTTSLAYRLDFMDAFIAYAKAWNEVVERNNHEQDQDLGFADWWDNTVHVSKTIESKEPIKGVGKIAR